jgi:3-hydroxyisobutyrate dehydrogenase
MSSGSGVGSRLRIGWIGAGKMGVPMCGHLIDRGYRATVFSRTKSKTEPLLKRGAEWAESPRAVAESADVTFTMVGFPDDVRDVYFGENGVLAGARQGTLLVDMTTTEPSLAREIAAEAGNRGLSALDAPVTGGPQGAESGSLSIMVGGDEEGFDHARPLLLVMGRKVAYQGPAGCGQHAKMCNQMVIACTLTGVCEALVYGYKAGLDLETMLASISGGVAACFSLETFAPRMITGDFSPRFFVDHFVKDLGIALEESRRMGLTLPGLELAVGLYNRVQELGHGRSGVQALIIALEDLSGISIRTKDQA